MKSEKKQREKTLRETVENAKGNAKKLTREKAHETLVQNDKVKRKCTCNSAGA